MIIRQNNSTGVSNALAFFKGRGGVEKLWKYENWEKRTDIFRTNTLHCTTVLTAVRLFLTVFLRQFEASTRPWNLNPFAHALHFISLAVSSCNFFSELKCTIFFFFPIYVSHRLNLTYCVVRGGVSFHSHNFALLAFTMPLNKLETLKKTKASHIIRTLVKRRSREDSELQQDAGHGSQENKLLLNSWCILASCQDGNAR